LLQLKDIDGVATGPNATKGLLMPRVLLEDPERLAPMYSYADAANTPTATDLAIHTGLVVFNMNQCLYRRGEDRGLYIWQQNTWTPLTEENLAENVSVFIDPRDGERYKTGSFGTAGVWMLENMRATTYTQSPAAPAALSNSTANQTAKNYVYPASPVYSPGSNGTNPDTFDKDHSLGLLYNWAAATNNENNTSTNQGGNYASHPVVQGICPTGWHLPSDKEWTDLENVIISNTSSYSTLPNIGGTALDYISTGNRGSQHGTALKATCSPVGTTTATSSGASLPATKNGMYIYLVGYSYGSNAGMSDYGILSYMWSSSSAGLQGTALSAWLRGIAAATVWRNYLPRVDFASVRCKKNNP